MPRAASLILAGLIAAAPASVRVPLGQYGRWGAFRVAPDHCFAIAEPRGAARHSRSLVAISHLRHGGSPRLFIAAGRPIQPGTPLRLEIGSRSFAISGSGGGDARADGAIIAALRAADRLRVSGIDARGRRFHDDYPLAGAPSAIDAAIVGCL